MNEISRRDLLKASILGTTAVVLASCDSSLPIKSLFPSQENKPNPTQTPEPTAIFSQEPTPTLEPTINPTAEPTLKPTPKPEPTPEKLKTGEIVWHGDTTKPYVYLTVDDCWNPSNVKKIFNAANKADIKITFLPVGRVIPLNPGLYKEIIAAGHAIENHTYNHPDLTKKTKSQIKTEILKARDALWKAVGFEYPQHFVRPPGGNGVFGYKNSAYPPLYEAAQELGYKILMWNVSSAGTQFGAYSATSSQIATVEKNVINHMKNGAVSLEHAIDVDTAAFPYILEKVAEKGFKPITIPQGLK